MLLNVIGMLVILAGCFAEPNRCPPQYLRLSSDHTMCKPPNSTCKILESGVTEEDKALILKIHNEFRNKIALGLEDRAGGMPQAADMLEMIWDDELAKLSQRHAETCNYGHDCKNCRTLERFSVGQNIGYKWSTEKRLEKDWSWFLNGLYEEVISFHKNLIRSFVSKPEYGHFTQIIWSRTSQVGCGMVYFTNENYQSYHYYVCNYGPAGNIKNAMVYKEGATCSSCPRNTCCGNNCQMFNLAPEYEGLCKMINETIPPAGYGSNDLDDIFYCSFFGEEDCKRTAKGKRDWKHVKTVNGNWIRIFLNGGQTATLNMKKAFGNLNHTFCFVIDLRAGPVKESNRRGLRGVVTFTADKVKPLKMAIGTFSRTEFSPYWMNIIMPKRDEIMITLDFSVEKGSPPQFVEIKQIAVKNKQCSGE